jgi:hypothetical protein
LKSIRKRLTFANVVSAIALFIALGGTVYAAGKISGKQIKPNSIPGNRLKKHTLTGNQINVATLGTVPSADNANTLAGQAPSAYEPASFWTRTGLVKSASGQTVSLATFGPFNLQLKCVAGSGSNVESVIDATSTEANSDGYGTEMTAAGTAYEVLSTFTSRSKFYETNSNAADFLTPGGKTYIADLTVGENYLGAACFANALISPS